MSGAKFRWVGTVVVVAVAALVATACAVPPVKPKDTTGAGWAPFPVVEPRNATTQQQYEPSGVAKRAWKICVVLPTLGSPLLPVPSSVAAVEYGIRDQAQRQGVDVTFFTATTNTAQEALLVRCSKSSDAAIVDYADVNRAGFATPVSPVRSSFPVVVADAPAGSFAAGRSRYVVGPSESLQAVSAVHWAIGARGGLPGTVVLLPGPAADAAGHPTTARAVAEAVHATMKSGPLTLVGTYYGADTLAAQHALVLKAMQQHPGLTYIIGTRTAALAAGTVLSAMNTNKRPLAVSIDLTPAVDLQIGASAIAAAMSSSPVIIGRIALDQAVMQAADELLSWSLHLELATNRQGSS